jgi:DNA-binding MarR family transcriptional regulator
MWKSTYSQEQSYDRPAKALFSPMMESKGAPRAAKQPQRLAAGETAAQFRLEEHLFYYFSQILARRNRRLNVELRRFGLDYSRWRVMAVLNEQPGCSMLQLADLTSVDRTTLTHTLRLMKSEGLIARRERVSDRRSIVLSLTPRGREMLLQILPTVLEQTERALTGFESTQVDALRKQLTRIAENLKD